MPISNSKKPFRSFLAPLQQKTEMRPLQKIVENGCCYFGRINDSWRTLLDSLSLSRRGESSGELSSVMI
jgi:hypothetical protein